DSFNQIGLERKNEVYEKFTNQGASTYLPIPFCVTDRGIGLYVNTEESFSFCSELSENNVTLNIPNNFAPEFFSGTPLEILEQLTRITGKPKLPPDWAFGVWISANRWNNQDVVEEQVQAAIHYGMKPSVIVLEAWSDETTFYRFNEEHFPNPKGMIDKLHEQGVRLILWQIPVLKTLEPGQVCIQHEEDRACSIENKFVVTNPDGSPYLIPKGRWFGRSMVPDFTNPAARDWWFGKRQYLLDMGVDGFKTDGGEFIYDDNACFFDGRTGLQMRNGYAMAYEKAYSDFIGNDRVLFSRAGYIGSQSATLHWAGDQQSTWLELRHVLTAGLNAGLSGLSYWGFDIAGFAGELPSTELYLRAFALACFSPIMQWHSEPLGGQFSGVLSSNDMVNDRSPWNIAKRTNSPEVISLCRNLCEERVKLFDYINEQARTASKTGRPMMAALIIDWPQDESVFKIDDEYMFGSALLVAPILEQSETSREVYLPKGVWRDYWSGEIINGPCHISKNCVPGEILVWRLEI
ncbi:MAG: glycoside hydrolase, partial [Clostridiales bacterium]|nr:glycoside hydrolase [Clostridiales bacterium]